MLKQILLAILVNNAPATVESGPYELGPKVPEVRLMDRAPIAPPTGSLSDCWREGETTVCRRQIRPCRYDSRRTTARQACTLTVRLRGVEAVR